MVTTVLICVCVLGKVLMSQTSNMCDNYRDAPFWLLFGLILLVIIIVGIIAYHNGQQQLYDAVNSTEKLKYLLA